MQKIIQKLKEGVLLGIGFSIAICLSVFGYNNFYIELEPNIETGNILSSDSYNQLLVNIKSLKNDLTTLSGSINTLKESIPKKGSNISLSTNFIGTNCQEYKSATDTFTTESKAITKGTYLATIVFNGVNQAMLIRPIGDGIISGYGSLNHIYGGSAILTSSVLFKVTKDTNIHFEYMSTDGQAINTSGCIYVEWSKITD